MIWCIQTLEFWKEYDALVNMRQFALLFNYGMTAADNPFILSGALDGSGIPADFFSDIHVRKAFNYAVDWQPVIDSVYGTEAIRSQGPLLWGKSVLTPIWNPIRMTWRWLSDELGFGVWRK